MQEKSDPRVNALSVGIEETLSSVFGYGTVEYNRYLGARNLYYSDGNLNFSTGGGGLYPAQNYDFRNYYRKGKERAISTLQQAIKGLQEELSSAEEAGPPALQHELESCRDQTKIFIVHGHEGESKQEVARFIEKIGFEAIVLHERPNQGRTIITKFREEAAGAGFAVVLMTPDDEGKSKDLSELKPRARQNVVFELGFFIGNLGASNVAALVKGDIERPSDFDGVVYISLDGGDWRMALARELKAAGYSVDWNKVMG
jgi:predicted nucleotide-binding protein